MRAPTRGLWVVVAAFVGQAFSLGTLLVFSFGVFAKPLARELHASRSAIALAVSILDVVVTLSAPFAGRLVDGPRARRVIVPSILALAAAIAALAFVEPPLWHLYALYALCGLVGVASTPITYARVVAGWFDRRRGLALGASSAGIGLGGFLLPSFAQLLIDRHGWRAAYLGFAAVTALVAAPTVTLLLRARPEGVPLPPDEAIEPRARGPAIGATLGEALRTFTFWRLFAVFFAVAACVNGTNANLAPLLTDRGASGSSAALATSLFGAATLTGRVASGWLVDRLFAPRVAAASFAAAAVGLALLGLGATGGGAYAAATLLGFAVGAESDVMPYLVSRYFGMRAMAALFGCIFASYTLGNAAGRWLVAYGFDVTGSYRAPLAAAFAVLVAATIATASLPAYPRAPA